MRYRILCRNIIKAGFGPNVIHTTHITLVEYAQLLLNLDSSFMFNVSEIHTSHDYTIHNIYIITCAMMLLSSNWRLFLFLVPVPPCIFYIANPSNTAKSISSKHEHVAVTACRALTKIA